MPRTNAVCITRRTLEVHAYHNDGYAYTLQQYKEQFLVPMQEKKIPCDGIWEVVGESGGVGCGGGGGL